MTILQSFDVKLSTKHVAKHHFFWHRSLRFWQGSLAPGSWTPLIVTVHVAICWINPNIYFIIPNVCKCTYATLNICHQSLLQALCPMPYALCPMPYALCSMLYALCSMLYALCTMLSKSWPKHAARMEAHTYNDSGTWQSLNQKLLECINIQTCSTAVVVTHYSEV